MVCLLGNIAMYVHYNVITMVYGIQIVNGVVVQRGIVVHNVNVNSQIVGHADMMIVIRYFDQNVFQFH